MLLESDYNNSNENTIIFFLFFGSWFPYSCLIFLLLKPQNGPRTCGRPELVLDGNSWNIAHTKYSVTEIIKNGPGSWIYWDKETSMKTVLSPALQKRVVHFYSWYGHSSRSYGSCAGTAGEILLRHRAGDAWVPGPPHFQPSFKLPEAPGLPVHCRCWNADFKMSV